MIKKFCNEFNKVFKNDKNKLLICQILLYGSLDSKNENLYEKFENFIYNTFPEMKELVNETVEICKHTKQESILNLFQKICELNKETENLNVELYKEFDNSRIMTQETISKIFALLIKDYFPNNDIKTILNPCIGTNELIHNICKIRNIQPIVYGYETSPVLAIMSYLDLLNTNNNLKHKIECKNFFDSKKDNVDLCVCNTLQHNSLKYVVEAMKFSKHGIFILPCNQINGINCPKIQKELLKIATIDRIIVLGSNVFNNNEDICILCCSNSKQNVQNIEIKPIMQNIEYFKYINRLQEKDVFKSENEMKLIKIITKKENATFIDITNLNWCIDLTVENLKQLADNEILQNFKNSNHIMTFEDIKKDIEDCEACREKLKNLDNKRFKLMNLNNIFELLEDEFEIIDNKIDMKKYIITKDGKIHKQTIFYETDYILKSLFSFDDINIYLLSSQLSNGFNKNIFKEIKVFIYL